MDVGIVLQQGGHPVVVAESVETHPGKAVGALSAVASQVLVERLMLVPEDRQVNLGANLEGEVPAGRGTARRVAEDRVLDSIAVPEGTDIDVPVAVRSVVAVPSGLGSGPLFRSVRMANPELHPHDLPGLDRPGAHLEIHALAGARVEGKPGRVRGEVPEVQVRSSSTGVVARVPAAPGTLDYGERALPVTDARASLEL